MYFDVIVGKDNLGSITRVLDANYDKQTGEAEFAKTPDYFTYSYDTGRKGLPAMSVYFEMQNLTRGVTLDEKNFPDEAFRALAWPRPLTATATACSRRLKRAACRSSTAAVSASPI